MSAPLRRGVLLLALAGTLAGCSVRYDASRLGVPVTMAQPAGSTPAGEAFRITQHATFALWGLVPVGKPSLQKVLASQLVGGKGVANLRIHERVRFFDGLVSVLTLGLVTPRSVTFEGVIVDQAP